LSIDAARARIDDELGTVVRRSAGRNGNLRVARLPFRRQFECGPTDELEPGAFLVGEVHLPFNLGLGGVVRAAQGKLAQIVARSVVRVDAKTRSLALHAPFRVLVSAGRGRDIARITRGFRADKAFVRTVANPGDADAGVDAAFGDLGKIELRRVPRLNRVGHWSSQKSVRRPHARCRMSNVSRLAT
jgi:hypothetical protein